MSKSFTLDDIKAATERQFGSTFLADVEMVNALRLPKKKRDELEAIYERLKDEDADQVEVFCDFFRLVAVSESEVNKLLEEVGDDLAMLLKMFEFYNSETELGEASSSASS